MRLAPILHDLAGRLSGRPAQDAREHPMPWAYALRDAVGLAHPDVLVSHWDQALEADALRGGAAGGAGDWVDRLLNAPSLADASPTKQTLELVRTLAELFRTGPVIAAAVTGPVTVAASLAPDLLDQESSDEERIELADLCADALAGLIGAYGDAGVSTVVVIEREARFVPADDVTATQSPLVRALAHHRMTGIVLPPPVVALATAGYEQTAVRWEGDGPPPPVATVSPELWALQPQEFAGRWRTLLAAAPGSDALLLSDGPLPADMPLENLQAAKLA